MRRKLLAFIAALFCSAVAAQALTLSQIRTQVRRNIRDTASSSTLQRYSDTVLLDFINEGQRDVVNQTWIVSKSTTITLSANTTYYSLPSDLINIERVTRANGNLPEVSLMLLDADSNNGAWEITGSTPTYFFQDRALPGSIGLYPYPSSTATAGTLKIIYRAFATDLAVDADQPFNALARYAGYHDLIVFYATYRILAIEALMDKAGVFKDLYDTRVQLLRGIVGAKPDKVPAVPVKAQKGG
jgi:hypothetical protein